MCLKFYRKRHVLEILQKRITNFFYLLVEIVNCAPAVLGCRNADVEIFLLYVGSLTLSMHLLKTSKAFSLENPGVNLTFSKHHQVNNHL